MSSLKITVDNQSGQPHSYILYQQKSAIAKAGQTVWPLAIAEFDVPLGGSTKITLPIAEPCYAYAFTTRVSTRNTIQETIIKQQVTLGKRQPDGTYMPGSTVLYSVTDGKQGLAAGILDDGNFNNAFQFKTSNFTKEDVKKGNFFIGYGSVDQAYHAIAATPNLSLHVTPSNVFYLSFVDVGTGSLINPEKIGNPFQLDFDILDNSVRVTHNKDGDLVLET